MPELPEVETVRAGLAAHVVGETILAARVCEPRSLRRHEAGPEHFVAGLLRRTISAVVRRGKFLWLVLDDEAALVIHLGMSGQLRLDAADHPARRHTRAELTLTGPSGPRALSFVDQRIFGWLALSARVPTADGGAGGFAGAEGRSHGWAEGIPPLCAHIARDPLDPAFDDEVFAADVMRRTASVKALLLNQVMVSGIGNIYADEALWAAGVRYDTPGRILAPAQVSALLAEVRAVLRRAVAAGGTSFDSLYVNVNGESGYFSRTLAVYGRAGQPCRRCGTAIVRERFANRSSFFCPVCQPPSPKLSAEQ